MFEDALQFINEEFEAETVSPAQLDKLLARGWRHFGTRFFRYSIGFYRNDLRAVIPLRVRLADFSPSKSQRRVLQRNSDLQILIRPIEITREVESLFRQHKKRFEQGIPDSIFDFVSRRPAATPCEAKEVAVYIKDKLAAVSYFDLGERATSGIYAMFDPSEHRRSLGIFTMLKEIEYTADSRKEYYYHGYCYEGESFYDYKKRFRGTESFDWKENWKRFPRT